MDGEYSEYDMEALSSEEQIAKTVAAEAIRDSIVDKVNNILWLDKLVAEENAYHERLNQSQKTDEKCMVCTLPYGTCVHTQQWIKESYTDKQNKMFDQSLDQSIDDMLNVMGEFNIETSPVLDDVDLSQMQWNLLEQSPVDKIGATNVALYSPDERGWHSCVKLDTHVLVFGGFKYRSNKQVPSPLATIPVTTQLDEEDVEYLTDIRVYDTQGLAWYGVRNPGEDQAEGGDGMRRFDEGEILQPEGRYGHMAAALDNNRMLVFGGKGKGGQVFGDTWIYHRDVNRWQLIQNNQMKHLPVPAARYFGACVSVEIPEPSLCRTTSFSKLKQGDKDIYLFGGTNGDYCFGDLWVFRGNESVLRWERLAAVGTAPCPRYGHQMVLLNEGQKDRFNQQLMVMGGCYVNPQGRIIESSLGKGDLYNLAASPTAEILRAEASTSTGIAEYDMIAAYKTSITPVLSSLSSFSSMLSTSGDGNNSNATHKKKKDKLMRHATTSLDAYVLNVGELIWRSQIYPKVSGSIPSARLHFSACCLGKHVFVLGGCQPTSFQHQLVEENTTVYVCDSDTMKWSIIDPINSNDHLKEPLRIAQADVIRAVRRCDEEKLRGISLGALNGRTIELAEAQAVLEVCKWRLNMLQTEQGEQSVAPPGRWGASLTPQGQRMLYVGGWEASRPVPKDKSVVLNVEQEHERRRRLDDEYSARLNKDRIREQAEVNMANAQSVFELRAIKEAELYAMNRDLKEMAREDILSALPPLSKPDCVQLVKANQHTIWVRWPRILRNSSRELVDSDAITYYLYMRSGFENLCINDRVFVTVPPSIPTVGGKKSKKRHMNKYQNALLMAYDSKEAYFDDQCRRYPAEITKASGDGKFDVVFDDGTGEKNVSRHRLKLAPPLDLSMVPFATSRPGTASASHSRPGTGDSRNSNNSQNSAQGTKPPKTSSVSAHTPAPAAAAVTARPTTTANSIDTNFKVVLNKRTSPSRSRPTTAETNTRLLINAALLQASQFSIQQDPVANKAVVPLEFAQSTRQRLINRAKRQAKAQEQSDKVFRGVVPPTEAELKAQSKAEKRLQSSQLRAEKALEKNQKGPKGRFNQSFSSYNSGAVSALTSPTNESVYENFSHHPSSYGNNNATQTKLKRQMSNVSFDETAHPDDPFSFINDDIQYYNDNNNLVKDYNTGEEYYNHTRGTNNNELQSIHDIPQYTVQVDGRWKLVYVGNDCEYSCTNLVSDAVLLQEPDITVPVAFAYQVHGADVPIYERSQLSTTVIFHTLPPSHFTMKDCQSNTVAVRKETQDSVPAVNGPDVGNKNTPAGKKDSRVPIKPVDKKNVNSIPPPPNKAVKDTTSEEANEQANPTVSTNTAMSRTKKEIISAVVGGQQVIQIERLNNFCQSYGVADAFM